MSEPTVSKPLYLTDDGSSFEWVEADSPEQAAERFVAEWGGEWHDYCFETPAETLQETHFRNTGEPDGYGDDLYERCKPDAEGAVRGFELEV